MRRRARQHQQTILWLAAIVAVAIATRPSRIMAGERKERALTFDELRELALSVGFAGRAADVAAAIAIAESGGDPWAQGDPRGVFQPTPNGTSTSFGLWQIHVPDHREFNAGDLLTTDYNARAAFLVSKGGTDFSPWSTYKNGDYVKYMPAEDA